MRPLRWELLRENDSGWGTLATSAAFVGPPELMPEAIKGTCHELCEASAVIAIDVVFDDTIPVYESITPILNSYLGMLFTVYVNRRRIAPSLELLTDKNAIRLSFTSFILSQSLHKAQINVCCKMGNIESIGSFAIDMKEEGIDRPDRRTIRLMEQYLEKYGGLFFSNEVKSDLGIRDGLGMAPGAKDYGRIAEVYKKYADYFRLNARFNLSTRYEVSQFNRIKEFSEATVRYIQTHPDQLLPSPTGRGINFRGKSFLPTKALVQSKVKDFNVPENRIVASFLRKVCLEADKIASVEENVKKLLKDLLNLYETMYSIKVEPLSRLPRPNSAITSIGPYRAIYSEILRYFRREHFEKEFSTFVNQADTCGKLYEHYCLLKILKACQEEGWVFEQTKDIDWEYRSDVYSNEDFGNAFLFSRGEDRRVVYFEPVIHSNNSRMSEELGLYRQLAFGLDENLTLQKTTGVDPVFTPDFVIKETIGGNNFFTIADAKFTTEEHAIEERLISFLLKYVHGIKTVSNEDKLNNFLLFCGVNGKENLSDYLFANPSTGRKEGFPCQIVKVNEG